MANTNGIKLKIVTPSEIIFEDYVNVVTIKTIEGVVGLMKGHIPIISTVQPSRFAVKSTSTNQQSEYAIGGGIIFTDGNEVQIATNDIISLDDKSLTQARKDVDSLKKELAQAKKESENYQNIESKLQQRIRQIDLAKK